MNSRTINSLRQINFFPHGLILQNVGTNKTTKQMNKLEIPFS